MSRVDSLHLEKALEVLAGAVGLRIGSSAGYGNMDYVPKVLKDADYVSLVEKVDVLCDFLGIEIKRLHGVVAMKKVTK